MNRDKIISLCKSIIADYNIQQEINYATFLHFIDDVSMKGLTMREAYIAYCLLEYYLFGKKFLVNAPNSATMDITPYNLVGDLRSTMVFDKDKQFEQTWSIERWGGEYGDNSNAEYFDKLIRLIRRGKAKEAYDKLNASAVNIDIEFDSVTMDEIAKGQANNDGEYIVYNDGEHVMTASKDSITIYKAKV
jgi:hypothetical protein